MGGLLIKDLYSAWKVGKGLVIVYIVFALDAVLTGEWVMGAMSVILISMLPGVLNGLDERGKWLSYLFCTPVSRKIYVTEKFVLSLICGAASTALLFIAFGIKTAVTGWTVGEDLPLIAAVYLFTGLVPSALGNVFSFRFGSVKGRIIMVIIVALFGIVSGASVSFSFNNGLAGMNNLYTFFPLVLIAVSLFMFALLYLISLQVIKKREY